MSDPHQPPTPVRPQHLGRALYTLQSVVVATVLGSLLAAVVVVCLNYRSLGSPALARKTAIAGSLVYTLFIASTALLPDSLLIGFMMILVQGFLSYLIANQLQGRAIRYHVAQGGETHSVFRAAAVGILTVFAILFLVVFALTLFQVGNPSG